MRLEMGRADAIRVRLAAALLATRLATCGALHPRGRFFYERTNEAGVATRCATTGAWEWGTLDDDFGFRTFVEISEPVSLTLAIAACSVRLRRRRLV